MLKLTTDPIPTHPLLQDSSTNTQKKRGERSERNVSTGGVRGMCTHSSKKKKPNSSSSKSKHSNAPKKSKQQQQHQTHKRTKEKGKRSEGNVRTGVVSGHVYTQKKK